MTKTSPSLSTLLCFSLLVTRALINQPLSWESSAKPNLTGDQSAHTVYDHSHPRRTMQPDALSPFQRPFFQVDLGQPVPECLHSAFYWSDWGGGDNCSYMMCKAPVKSSSPTNQHQVYTHETAVNRHYMRLEGKCGHARYCENRCQKYHENWSVHLAHLQWRASQYASCTERLHQHAEWYGK